MPTLAATATPETTLTGLLCLATVIATLCYGIGCWIWPFGNCRKCKGSGKRRSPFGRAFGLCRRCHGDGRRLRIGRRIINSLRELHDKGTR
ncbi:hypothetical protein [Pseudosporangium ferrugineum]|uniref:Uncharacterized protein n=1 Tax=Pseudosporangium ferrugineum TaxID=439699 RepID=A0A2T0RD90_9ACTN|nr:hypothetical protein [Pseudosporangium ferrugineum]PRY19135.1 hypothetical protein CLV70_13812 [Pseudosporangium ferrugineum]